MSSMLEEGLQLEAPEEDKPEEAKYKKQMEELLKKLKK